MGHRLQLIAAANTEAKHPGKKENQDAVYALVDANHNVTRGLFIVADGVGGHKEGSLASKIAVQTIPEMVLAGWDSVPAPAESCEPYLKDQLYQAIADAHHAIFSYAKMNQFRMGSTVTCALVYRNLAIVANVGDSRTYLFRYKELQQITKDHSLVAWLVEQGHISPEETHDHPYRNVLMHALGSHESPQIDIFVQPLQVGDQLLLCSDGVWDSLRDEELAEFLRQADSPDTAVANILKAGQDHSDDISIIVVHVNSQ